MLCISSEYYPVGLSPVDNRTGICRNITTGIHLDILYAETGRSNDFPIYEILGSRVRYILLYPIFGRVSTTSAKGDNFCGFLLVLLHTKPHLKRPYYKRKEILSF